jgi:hypothetical protein
MSKIGARGACGFTATARRAALKVRTARANANAADLAPILKELQAADITSLNGIAAALNERRVPTPAGSGHWHAAQVSRVLRRLAGQTKEQPMRDGVGNLLRVKTSFDWTRRRRRCVWAGPPTRPALQWSDRFVALLCLCVLWTGCADAKGDSPGYHELHPPLWKHSRPAKAFSRP